MRAESPLSNIIASVPDHITTHYLSRIKAAGIPHADKIPNLPAVLQMEPFISLSDGQRIGLLSCDWDGVVRQGWFDRMNGNREQNERNIEALLKIRCLSSDIILWSSRIPIPEFDHPPYAYLEEMLGTNGGISHMPFVTESDKRYLYHLLDSQETIVGATELKFGLGKIFRRQQDLTDKMTKKLTSGQKVAVIGSSVIDHQRMLNLAADCDRINVPLNNLHYFTTGRIVW